MAGKHPVVHSWCVSSVYKQPRCASSVPRWRQPCLAWLLKGISFSVVTIKTAAHTGVFVCDRGFSERVYCKNTTWAPGKISCLPRKAIGSYNQFYSTFMKSRDVCLVNYRHHLAFFRISLELSLVEGEYTWGMTGIFMPFIQNTHNQEFTDWFFSMPLSLLWAFSNTIFQLHKG